MPSATLFAGLFMVSGILALGYVTMRAFLTYGEEALANEFIRFTARRFGQSGIIFVFGAGCVVALLLLYLTDWWLPMAVGAFAWWNVVGMKS